MIKPQIQDFLIGTAIFAVSFIVAFYAFGGGDKVVRVFEAHKVAQANKNFEQKLVEEKEQQQEGGIQGEGRELEGLIEEEELVGVKEGQSVEDENKDADSKEIVEVIEVVETEVPTAQELALKFQDVLDLGGNEEWQSYPLDLRKEAFAIMNPPAEEVIDVVDPEVSAQEVDAAKTSQLDQVFMGVEQEREEQVVVSGNLYTVQEGDSWWVLADKFQTTPAILQELNSNITDLSVGMVIVTPSQ